MGCVNSKDINDTHPNIFQVVNVNDSGVTISPGKLQVTDTELVYYQKGKGPVRWPLKTLRKYGFDADVFSFECGRRCATGEGIYAFKTRKADQLFNLMQLKTSVHNEGEGVAPDNPSQLDPQTVVRLDSRPGSIVGLPPTSPSPPPVEQTVELEKNNNRSQDIVYINLDVNRRETPNYQNVEVAFDDPMDNSHSYVNVDVKEVEHWVDEGHSYANINTDDLDLSVPPTPSFITTNINYIEVDLKTTAAKTSTNTEATPDSYATIDFQKTVALSNSINPSKETEEGSRKTRHNSTISDVTTRHSNSLSD
ncbi:fibroblast growth factor receptor substrate 3 [Aethina tumida]|uniref:fibroblast growth factor receptor substrate 3 n=1 Tax=Aethina tumida TaxID=116153 RepID=UPI0021493B51|nr:fibroblast growth factor receptor substrate 3 [Aethina tumida]